MDPTPDGVAVVFLWPRSRRWRTELLCAWAEGEPGDLGAQVDGMAEGANPAAQTMPQEQQRKGRARRPAEAGQGRAGSFDERRLITLVVCVRAWGRRWRCGGRPRSWACTCGTPRTVTIDRPAPADGPARTRGRGEPAGLPMPGCRPAGAVASRASRSRRVSVAGRTGRAPGRPAGAGCRVVAALPCPSCPPTATVGCDLGDSLGVGTCRGTGWRRCDEDGLHDRRRSVSWCTYAYRWACSA